MTAVYQIDPLRDSRWADFLQRHPRASVFHTATWLTALQRTYGYEPIGFTTSPPGMELENALLACRVDSWLTGHRLVSLPFSDHCEPLVNHPADLYSLFEAVQQQSRDYELSYIELRPLRQLDTRLSLFQNNANFCLHQLDLNPELDALYRNCHKSSIQRKIKRAEREGLVIREGRSDLLLDTFYHLQRLTRRRHGLPPQSRSWFRNLAESFGEALKIRVAYKSQEAIAAILTLQFKDTLVYKYGCSDARFHRLGGVHFLFWNSIREAKESGLKCFDLGRSDENNPGLITFKDRWGAARSTLSYVRYSLRHPRPSTGNRKHQISKQVFAHAPNWFLSVASSLLYKHVESIPSDARTDLNSEYSHPKPIYTGRIKAKSNNSCVPDRAGAVVIGGDYQGLGIVRSLGRQGIPVCVVDDERSIARYSRYTTFSQRVPSLREAKETVEVLLDLGQRNGLQGWVLYPTRDETVAALSQYRAELSKVFRVPTPCWQTINWLWDKRKTYQLAQQLGIPTPRTWYMRDMTDLEQFDGHFPVALKPAIKEHFIYATKDKAWRADSLAELRELFQEASKFLPPDEIMIQDLIPGDGACQYAYCSFFKHRESLAGVVACRRRQHPHEFGRASTYVETLELPVLEEYAKRFLTAINYYGLVEVEFKRDPRDGEYRLLDVNGRTWGYHTIGRRAGLDFPYLLFADQMQQPVEPVRGKPGVRWIRLLTDLPSGVVGILSGHLGLRPYARSLLQYDEEAVFSMEDPLPGVAEVALFPYLFMKRGF
jgi:D-aspartate ligase